MRNIINTVFYEYGLSDGYNNSYNRKDKIIKELYGEYDNERIIDYINEYLKGYETGTFANKNASNIFDDLGECYEEFEPSDHSEEAKCTLLKYLNKMEVRVKKLEK